MRSRFFYILIVFGFSLQAFAQDRNLEWNFKSQDDIQGWTFSHLSDVKVENGVLRVNMTGNDPFLVSPSINLEARRWQVVGMRVKTNSGDEDGDLFFTNTNEGPFGGFNGKKRVSWSPIGDNQWHEYRIYPFWNAEKSIVKFRIDFPNLRQTDVGKRSAEIAWIRVVDLGQPPNLDDANWDFKQADIPFEPTDGLKTQKIEEGLKTVLSETADGFLMSKPFSVEVDHIGYWVCIAFADAEPGMGTLRFATDTGGFRDVPFIIDGKGVCNVNLGNQKGWDGNLQMIGVKPGDKPNAQATIRAIRISETPLGPPRIKVDTENSGLVNAINRVGQKLAFETRLDNIGGKPAEVQWKLILPDGLAFFPGTEPKILTIEPGVQTKLSCDLVAEKPFAGNIRLEITAFRTGRNYAETDIPVSIGPSLNLPKASYVPEPKPVKSDYEISALYYGGWHFRSEWDRIERSQPIRKPVLGWYDESNPECIDWQIKWAVENGIQNFFVCWYWNRGAQHKNEWVAAFPKAKYKSYLKWCVMWANHHGGGTHSEEDQEKVVDYWIEHFFKTSEYHTIDGKPVVMLWSPKEMDDDIREIERKKGNELKQGEGVKRMLELSRRKVVAAGLKGIYFMCMKHPEGSTDPMDIEWLAEAGFDSTTIYHYMEDGGKAANKRLFDFKLVAESSLPFWEAWKKASPIPFQPNISSGWDDRPWNNHKTIYGRTVPLFRNILQDYKKFAAQSGLKRVMLAPMNEWGEGSYLEPNREFGFGMYEAVREELCQKPEDGWPLNFGPSDIGLGPYDLPPTDQISRTSWDFSTGFQGWTVGAQIEQFQAADGRLTFKTTGTDPVMNVPLALVPASNFDRLVVRMKVTPASSSDSAQIFWMTPSMNTLEEASVRVPLKNDESFHDYTFDLSENKRWKGRISGLRFDPSNRHDVAIEIESIALLGPDSVTESFDSTKSDVVKNASNRELQLKIIDDWKVRFKHGAVSIDFEIERPEIVQISDEKLNTLPVYNEKGAPYNRGACLAGVRAQECSVFGAIDLKSVIVQDEKKEKTFRADSDYKIDSWGRIGRLEDGEITEKQPVFVSYGYAKMRLDSIVLRGDGSKPVLRQGTAHVSQPELPILKENEKRLANIWIYGAMPKLTDESLFPVFADHYPESMKKEQSVAERLLPKTLKKLQNGGKVHVLAWGDSVTDANYLPDKNDRWQIQFVERLRKAFPKAEIVLTTQGWGARNSKSFLDEPPGSPHNYMEKIVGANADLVVMEFINDSWYSEQVIFERYKKILTDFNEVGTEWIILTPHYMRADMMGLKSNKNIDDDPRPYVQYIRKFGRENNVAVAEGSKRYGHLWRQGIPYQTLLMNSINHPNGFGMSLFADALMELFPTP